MGGFGSQRPADAAGIRFAIIAIDVWLQRPSRYAALKDAKARHAERNRFAKWASGGDGDRYGKDHQPLLAASKLDVADMQHMRELRRTPPGILLYSGCALATAIELQRCWSSDLLDHIAIRIDLEDEIGQIASIAASINSAESALGPKPSGDLGKDSQVMAVYERRRTMLDERITLLLERVRTLNRYWTNLKSLDKRVRQTGMAA